MVYWFWLSERRSGAVLADSRGADNAPLTVRGGPRAPRPGHTPPAPEGGSTAACRLYLEMESLKK